MGGIGGLLAVAEFDAMTFDIDAVHGLVEGMTNREQMQLLYDEARRVRTGCIVEVGSYRGRSTCALAHGSRDGARVPVFAIEPHEDFTGVYGGTFGAEDRRAFYSGMLATSCYETVRLVNLSSEVVTPGWRVPVSFLFIDGDHSLEAVVRDFRAWEPHLLPSARVALDDAMDPEVGPYQLLRQLSDEGWRTVSEAGRTVLINRD